MWLLCCKSFVQKQDVTILGYHLVHWEDSEALAHGCLSIVNGCKEGPLLCKVYSYNYMFGVGPTWSPAYFVLRCILSGSMLVGFHQCSSFAMSDIFLTV